MKKISLYAQRQAVARAIDLQRKIAAGQTVRAQMAKSQEELQLDRLRQVQETLAWLEQHREAVAAMARAGKPGAAP